MLPGSHRPAPSRWASLQQEHLRTQVDVPQIHRTGCRLGAPDLKSPLQGAGRSLAMSSHTYVIFVKLAKVRCFNHSTLPSPPPPFLPRRCCGSQGATWGSSKAEGEPAASRITPFPHCANSPKDMKRRCRVGGPWGHGCVPWQPELEGCGKWQGKEVRMPAARS